MDSSARRFLEKEQTPISTMAFAISLLFFSFHSYGIPGLAVFCVCVTFGHLSSASRFARACSIGDVQGVALHIAHIAKGRPLRLMRISGRSGWFLSRLVFIALWQE